LLDKNSVVSTKIRNVSVQKLDEKANQNTPVVFEFGVNLEESERSMDSIVLSFKMKMEAEPAIVRFNVEGTTSINGEEGEIEKLLAPDPQTNVPIVFTSIYQNVYAVIFMLAGTVDVPYPSPALLKKAHVRTAYPAEMNVAGPER